MDAKFGLGLQADRKGAVRWMRAYRDYGLGLSVKKI